MRAVARAAVGDGGAVVHELNGGEHAAAVADGVLQREAGLPGLFDGSAVFGAVEDTGGFGKLHAGFGAEPHNAGVFVDGLYVHPLGNVIEEDVARFIDRGNHIHGQVRVRLQALEIMIQIGVAARAAEVGTRCDDALFQRGDGGAGLHGGAGRIGAFQRAVPQRRARILGQRRVILGEGGNVIARVRKARQNFAVVDVFNDDRAGGVDQTVFPQRLQTGGQRVLRHFLQVLFDGQNDGVALRRLHGVIGGDVALGIGHDTLFAHRAAQVAFHRALDALFTDDGIHAVAALFLLRLFIFFRTDHADAPQNMRQQRAVGIFAVGHDLHVHPAVKIGVFLDARDHVVGHVVGEGVEIRRAEIRRPHPVADRRDLARQLRRKALQLVIFDQRVHAVLHGGVGVQFEDFRAQHVDILLAVCGKAEGLPVLAEGDGQFVVPRHALLLKQRDERVDDGVALALFLRRREKRGIEHDGVALPVGHQGIAVAVKDFASRALDRHGLHFDLFARFDVFFAVHDLNFEKGRAEYR